MKPLENLDSTPITRKPWWREYLSSVLIGVALGLIIRAFTGPWFNHNELALLTGVLLAGYLVWLCKPSR